MALNRFGNWFIFAAGSVVLVSSPLAAPAINNVVLVQRGNGAEVAY